MSRSSLEVWVAAYFKQNPTTAHDEQQTTDCWPMDVVYRYHSVSFFSAHTASFQPRFHPYYCPWPPFSSSNTGSLIKFDLILQISVKFQKRTVGLQFCSGQTFHCVNSEDYIVFCLLTQSCLFLLKYISTHQVQRLLHVPQLSRWNSFMRNSCLMPLKTSEINILLWVSGNQWCYRGKKKTGCLLQKNKNHKNGGANRIATE